MSEAKQWLVAIDGSANSESAFHFAIDRMNKEIDTLHLIDVAEKIQTQVRSMVHTCRAWRKKRKQKKEGKKKKKMSENSLQKLMIGRVGDPRTYDECTLCLSEFQDVGPSC